MPTPCECRVFDLLIKILGDDQHQEDITMGELVKVLEMEIDNGSKEGVIVVLEDILDYAKETGDSDLIIKTLDIIYIMKEEN